MASSDLTLALLMGGAQPGMMSDPRIAGAYPKLQLAQSLIGEGTSTAPTPKAGLFARLAQALTGSYLMNDTSQKLQDLAGQQNTDAVNAMRYIQTGDNGLPASGATSSPGASSPAAPGGYGTQIAQAESSGNPAAVNAQGYSGLNQWGTGRLADLGLYTPAQGENLKANQWAGTLNIPGFPNVRTQQDFLHSPDAQKAVMGLDIHDIDKNIASTPGADKFDVNGLRAVANLGGIQGMKDFISTGGQYNPHDPNGTHLTDYYQRFSGTPVQGAGTVQTGVNAPGIGNALAMMQRAQAVMLANPYNPQLQRAAQMQMQYAQTLMGMDNFVTGPGGIQVNTRTGQQSSAPSPLPHYEQTPDHSAYVDTTGTHPPAFPPTPRIAQTGKGATIAVGPGGNMTTVEANPSGIAGNAPENVQMRVMADVGGKLARGEPLTPEEIGAYNAATTAFRDYGVHQNPATGALESIPARPMPAGMPTADGAPQGNTQLTAPSLGPQAAQKVTEGRAAEDFKNAAERQQAALQGHDIFGTTQTIRSTLPQVTTGVGAEQRLAVSRALATLGLPPDEVKSAIGTNAAPGEILQKELFKLSTGAVRGMGAREPGSVLQMFQKNYPNMTSQNMTVDAMTRLLDMDQLYKEDDASGALSHLNGQLAELKNNKDYNGLSGYQQPDPRTYQAAALASGGMPYDVWSRGLTAPQQTEALKLAARKYPDAAALDSKGVRHFFQGGGGG